MAINYLEIKKQIRQKLSKPIDFEDTDNLLELGLSSLVIMKLVNQWRKQGIKISFGVLMEHPTLREWWELIQKTLEKADSKKRTAKKEKRIMADMYQEFPLTDVQYAYWVGRDERQALGGIGCHAYLEFDGKAVDQSRLRHAWAVVQQHHPMLRACFLNNGAQKILRLSFNGRWFIKVKVNHLLYKVDNLKESVDYYRNLGFTVEYGRKEKPYNALIYFQEGPYIELINNMNMPWYIRIFLRLIGKKRFMQGMINQENESEGFIRICFECEKSELEKICSLYRKYRKNIMKIKVKRVDTKGRKLQCQTIFPEEEKIPFVRTPFENNYKIENASHPNGAKRIISVEYGINDDDQNLLHEMNSDKILKLKQGTGISHVIIETSTQKNFEFK